MIAHNRIDVRIKEESLVQAIRKAKRKGNHSACASFQLLWPLYRFFRRELATGSMDQDSLMEQARSTNIDAVILESHRNGVDN